MWTTVASPRDETSVQMDICAVVLVASYPHDRIVDWEDVSRRQMVAEGDLNGSVSLGSDYSTKMPGPIRIHRIKSLAKPPQAGWVGQVGM